MPTAAKMVAALAMAGVGFLTSYVVILYAVPGGLDGLHRIGWFREINTVLGFLLGWRMLGGRAGETWWLSLMAGVITAAVLLAACLALYGFEEMIAQALKSKYDAPMKAADAWMGFIVKLFQQSLVPEIYGTLFGGAALASLLAHVTAKTWR